MSSSSRRHRNSRSLSPPKAKGGTFQDQSTCDRCQQLATSGEKKTVSSTKNKAQQTKTSQDNQQKEIRHGGISRRNSAPKPSYTPGDANSRSLRQANLVCTKHEKEKVKMQATIDKLQEAFCEKESKLQDARSQLVRERRMSEIMERQLKNARNLSEQLGRIVNDREHEIRTLKNALNKKHDGKSISDVQPTFKSNVRQTDKRRLRDEFHTSMRRSSSTSEQSECNSLSAASVDNMLKEVHSLVEGLKIKDEAIKGLQEECTRRLDKIQKLQRSVKLIQDQLTQTTQLHDDVCVKKDNLIAQLQHALKKTEDTVESLLNEKTKVAKEGQSTIQELQNLVQQKELTVKRMQSHLEEVLESKENDVNQLKSSLDRQQKELEVKEKALVDVSEELYSSQMAAESLKMELNQEKCSLSRMSEEINSLVDKLTNAVAEMENTKLEYEKKDERLRSTEIRVRELYMTFFGDRSMVEKLQSLCQSKRELSGRKVLSEEDVIQHSFRHQTRNRLLKNENKCSNNSVVLSNTQIHKQQLAELQQQVTESQTVCGILQDQLKEVTDFLDQLLRFEISPKNLSALSAIREYGKHLPAPVNILSISKERIAPDGVSSNSQLDIESPSKQITPLNDIRSPHIAAQQSDAMKRSRDPRPGSCDNLSFYHHQQHHQVETSDQNFTTFRSLSAEDVQQNTFPTDHPQLEAWDQSEDTGQQDTGSESDEILLLINDRDITSDGDSPQGLTRPAVPSPPFQHGLIVKENYGSTGSINTRDKENFASLERSASFGSFSGSVMMSYEQSGRTSNEDSSLMRSRCIRSIDMMDIIQVGNPGTIGVGLSSDTDIWSEPDMGLARQRMGLKALSSEISSNVSLNDSSEDSYKRRRLHVHGRGEDAKKNAKILRQPTRRYASKQKRWVERLKGYLNVFEEASYNLTDELNNLCQVKTDLLAVVSSAANERVENNEVILMDLAEYIRLNYSLQEKVDKTIHYNRQLIDASGKNVCCTRQQTKQVRTPSRETTVKPSSQGSRSREKRLNIASPEDHEHSVLDESKRKEASDIQTQLAGYHATLLSCQDMIKDLHSQLKERHCSELMNKHELNRTVYGYLEDIDTCIEELCKKMESTGENPEPHGFKQSYDDSEVREDNGSYPTFSSALMEKLRENEDRLLRFEDLLNRKEQELKMSGENVIQLEVQLNSIKQSLYEIQMDNLELKECLEFSESKQLEIEDSSSQMLRDIQLTMQRLSDLEERFRCIDAIQLNNKDDDATEGENSVYPIEYEYHDEERWVEEVEVEEVQDDISYSRDWESQDY